EQRRTRRWNMAFKFGLLAYLVVLLMVYLPGRWFESEGDEPHTALVDIRGVITDGSEASADRIVSGLQAAFEDEQTRGVILRINSPGGSPVQAAYINDEMTRLRKEFPDIPLYAVISDIGASGGYYVAAAADKIYANESSIVGSIGVLMNGFGFV
ncbi:MAG: S49 family peptidase, partial [Gammaproteobacteria bacterium]|nr:S49 family peptidase [Gammaproteobacteria bacterium]